MACPPTGAAADSVLALPTPPQGGSELLFRRTARIPRGEGLSDSRGGPPCPPQRPRTGRDLWDNPRRGCHYNGLTAPRAEPLIH